ncbi:hypothetical protein DdX_17681 [Ditylenchus destructor]|uniref:Uncharacterized protein n=1 Tax=Ditylenchus destructor TaxID=166010 RepID=A0AAD4MLZ8_9BILA|nr:hypothetical protein DdX_17681 [Ditylenchus destructor]
MTLAFRNQLSQTAIIVLSGDRRIHDDPLEEVLSGKDIIRNGNYGEIYTISNGRNRMRIEFVREPEKRDPRVRCYLRRSLYETHDIRVTVEASGHFFT